MSLITFPSSPSLYQTFTVGSKTWIWNGSAWDLQLANTTTLTAFTNSAFTQANSAFIVANGAFIQANASYQSQNTTGSYANSAFGVANTAASNTVLIFGIDATQNSSITAAFIQANLAYTQSNSSAIYANGAFTQANAAYQSQNTTGSYANSAFTVANNASSNTILTQGVDATQNTNITSATNSATAAFIQANAAYQSQNTTGSYANSAFGVANNASSNTTLLFGIETTQNTSITAVTTNTTAAFIQANSAFIQANLAYTQSNSAAVYANGAFAQANAALSNTGSLITFNGLSQVVHPNTTASTSNTTGSLVVSGGVGVAGNVNVGGSITAIGNLGIGTSSPAYKLDVSGTSARLGGGGSYPLYLVADSGGLQLFNASGGATGDGVYLNGASHYLGFYTNSSERMRLDSSGNLGIGTTSPGGYRFKVKGGNTNNMAIDNDGSQYTELDFLNNGTNKAYFYWDNTNSYFLAGSSGAYVFSTAGSERARIDSSGNLGIGTSSPATALDITSANTNVANFNGTGTNGTAIKLQNSGTNTFVIGSSKYLTGGSASEYGIGTLGATPIIFVTNGSERARIDSSGNFGLGVTPSAWGASNWKAIELGSGSLASYQTLALSLFQNAYNNGSNYVYKTTAAASFCTQSGGSHQWFTAPSGTAGNAISFTQAMTLNASGQLGIGTTSPSSILHLSDNPPIIKLNNNASNDTPYIQGGTSGAGGDGYLYLSGGASRGVKLAYNNGTVAATVDGSGNFLVGTTTTSTSTTTGALTVSGGLGVAGNVYANSVYSGGALVLTAPSAIANSAAVYANGAFAQANAAFAQDNLVFSVANSAGIYANGAFAKANAAFTVANGAAFVANTDYTTISATAGVYGGTTAIPVITLAANGRISSISNTSFTSGGVTSVTGTSPVVSSGGTTPAISLASGYGDTLNPYASKTANYFLAAPNGSAGVPTFRAIVAADIPTLNQSTTGSAGSVSNALTFSTGLVVSSGTTYNGSAAITLSIPQAITTTSSVQFGSFGVGTAASGTTGEIRATNNITAYYSDDRLKTRFNNIDNALAKVLSLNGFYYQANETAQALGYQVKSEVGVSAQEVQAILPEIVVPAPIDDKYLTVHYDKLIPLLIEAIKEQQKQIDDLKAMINIQNKG